MPRNAVQQGSTLRPRGIIVWAMTIAQSEREEVYAVICSNAIVPSPDCRVAWWRRLEIRRLAYGQRMSQVTDAGRKTAWYRQRTVFGAQ